MRAFFLVILITVSAFEALCFVGENESLGFLPERFRLGYFAELKPTRSELGWGAYAGRPRPAPAMDGEACLLAFGDSFVHADEVEDAQAWPSLLAGRLGCRVDNYGVGGYGQDQAYLRYREMAGRGAADRLILMGVYQEMLRRNLVASWLFYSGDTHSHIKPYFFLKGDALVPVSPVGVPGEARAMKRYHRRDYYYAPYRFEFPYLLSLARMAWYRYAEDRVLQAAEEDRAAVFANAEATALAVEILRGAYREEGRRLVLLVMPHAGQVYANQHLHQAFAARLAKEFPLACVIDPFASLRAAYVAAGEPNLQATNWHFNATGNRVLAEAVLAGLDRCGVRPLAARGQALAPHQAPNQEPRPGGRTPDARGNV
ncbi:MAG: hypothetical protein LJE84_03425 [Gammaproteobacteria bacterium]|nr:hypothetical protein [Gammaproteobacteria bacterium]